MNIEVFLDIFEGACQNIHSWNFSIAIRICWNFAHIWILSDWENSTLQKTNLALSEYIQIW